MLRRFNLFLAALVMLIAPVAMQSGVAMAAMPGHGEMARDGHCGDLAPESDDKPGAVTPCCLAMCAAVAPVDTAIAEPMPFPALVPAGLTAIRHRPFLAELPTPPPRMA